MAKKATSSSKNSKAAAKSSPVRNTPIPREPVPTAKAKAAPTAAVIKQAVTHGDIAVRAYYISRSSESGDQLHNWLRAERELSV